MNYCNKLRYKIWKHYFNYFNQQLKSGQLKQKPKNRWRYKALKHFAKHLEKKNLIPSQIEFHAKIAKMFKQDKFPWLRDIDECFLSVSRKIDQAKQSNLFQQIQNLPMDLRWQIMPPAKQGSLELVAKTASYQALNETILRQLREKLKFQKKVRVAFYVIKIFQFESLYREMEKDPRFEPFIVVIPDKLRHLETPTDETYDIYQSYKTQYQSVYLGYDFGRRKPIDFTGQMDILFFTIPYGGMHYPEHFIWHALSRRILTCFQNYGYFTTKWGRTQIAATSFYNCCWRVFADSVDSFRDLQLHQPFHAKNAIITGYCKMDDFSKYEQTIPNKRKTILVSPHHTVWDFSGICLSNFLRYADFLVELPAKYPQLDFIFRPHPLLFYNLVYGKHLWTEQQRNEYLEKMTSYPNVTFDENVSFFESFARSDACIHDCGSFTGEYLYTEKPCCYMLRDEAEIKDQFLPVGEKCLTAYYKAFCEADIEHFIQSVVLKNEDPLEKERKFIAKEIKVNYPNVGKYILNYLKKELFQ